MEYLKSLKPIQIVIIAVLIVFANSLDNPFVLDDLSKIYENADIRSLKELPSRLVYPYYEHQVLNRNDPSRPLVFITYAINYAISGVKPWSYHLFDVLMHLAIGLLLFRFIKRWLHDFWPEKAELWACLAAAFYLLHPLNAGTVIYAYGRTDVLSTLLVFLGLNMLVFPPAVKGTVAIGLTCFVLSLFAKQSSVVFPVLLLTSVYFLRDKLKRDLKFYFLISLAAFCVVGIYLFWRKIVLGGIGDLEAAGKVWSLYNYVTVQPLVITKYIKLFFWPMGQAIDHFIIPENTFKNQRIWGAITLVIIGFVAWLLGRSLKTPLRSMYYWGLSFYVLNLLPTSSVLPTVDALVERRVYMSNIGLVVSLIALFIAIQKYKPKWQMANLAGWIIGVLSLITVWRNHIFDDAKGIWAEVIKTYPLSPRALNNMSTLYMRDKQFDDAEHVLSFMAKIYTNDPFVFSNLGSIYADEAYDKRDPNKAEEYFRIALRIQPNFAESWYGLGRLYQLQGQLSKAEDSYLKAIEASPIHLLAYNNLGVLYQNMGEMQKAEEIFKKGLAIDPQHELLRRNMLGGGRNFAESEGKPPDSAPMGRGQPIKIDGRSQVPMDVPSELIVQVYEKALATDPKNKNARINFALICVQRKLPCARQQLKVLLSEDPENKEYKQLMGEVEKLGL